ncbi:hypothetical protein M5D96_003556, partial [Drosophila gunungcola]
MRKRSNISQMRGTLFTAKVSYRTRHFRCTHVQIYLTSRPDSTV